VICEGPPRRRILYTEAVPGAERRRGAHRSDLKTALWIYNGVPERQVRAEGGGDQPDLSGVPGA